jgi:calcineurin-like phosphoesterase family protein
MGEEYAIGDLHLGHKAILHFSPQRGGSNVDEHNEWIIHQWNSTVKHKNDMVWVMGDVAFSLEALKLVGRLKGYKRLVRGNHDQQSTENYLEYFNNVFGIVKHNGLWLSHAPIHPRELRGKFNVHGHVHQNTIPDRRYFNVSVEALNGIPIKLTEIKERLGTFPEGDSL